jgi:hypothetical protein
LSSREAHLQRAQTNAAFRGAVVAAQLSPGWAVVVLFYEAVHRFEAWFAAHGIHNGGHIQRNRAIIHQFPEISFLYVDLYNASRVARYDASAQILWSQYELFAESYTEIKSHLDR